MSDERRGANRANLPEPVRASLSGTEVRIVEISEKGARVQHDARLSLGSVAKLSFDWRDESVLIPVSIVHSQVTGRGDAGLVYGSGLRFAETTIELTRIVDLMVAWAEGREAPVAQAAPVYHLPDPAEPPPAEPAPAPSAPTPAPAARTVSSFLRDEEPAFLQARLTAKGWIVNEVHVPKQPEDGFTIRAERRAEMSDLQRTFEYADPDTRRMIRIAFEADCR
ncbi:MAG: PilZ domain-containing protein [Thermoanaerobaculia bacterium]